MTMKSSASMLSKQLKNHLKHGPPSWAEDPLTHDISALLDLLEGSGEDVKRYWDLMEYNVFAVRFRYESLEVPDEPLDRAASIGAIEDLMGHVVRLLENAVKE